MLERKKTKTKFWGVQRFGTPLNISKMPLVFQRGKDSLLYISAVPGSDKIALFASTDSLYPNKEDNKWSSLDKIPSKFLPKETELDPFILNEKYEIEYCMEPKKP